MLLFPQYGISKDWACELSPGQTDLQVVASGRKLNLRRGLRWVAKRTRKFPRKFTLVAKKTFWGRISFISLANNRLMDVTQLTLIWLGGQMVKNLLWLASKVIANHRKSTQVHARPGQTESQEDPSFQLASTFDFGWPGLKLCIKLRLFCGLIFAKLSNGSFDVFLC